MCFRDSCLQCVARTRATVPGKFSIHVASDAIEAVLPRSVSDDGTSAAYLRSTLHPRSSIKHSFLFFFSFVRVSIFLVSLFSFVGAGIITKETAMKVPDDLRPELTTIRRLLIYKLWTDDKIPDEFEGRITLKQRDLVLWFVFSWETDPREKARASLLEFTKPQVWMGPKDGQLVTELYLMGLGLLLRRSIITITDGSDQAACSAVNVLLDDHDSLVLPYVAGAEMQLVADANLRRSTHIFPSVQLGLNAFKGEPIVTYEECIDVFSQKIRQNRNKFIIVRCTDRHYRLYRPNDEASSSQDIPVFSRSKDKRLSLEAAPGTPQAKNPRQLQWEHYLNKQPEAVRKEIFQQNSRPMDKNLIPKRKVAMFRWLVNNEQIRDKVLDNPDVHIDVEADRLVKSEPTQANQPITQDDLAWVEPSSEESSLPPGKVDEDSKSSIQADESLEDNLPSVEALSEEPSLQSCRLDDDLKSSVPADETRKENIASASQESSQYASQQSSQGALQQYSSQSSKWSGYPEIVQQYVKVRSKEVRKHIHLARREAANRIGSRILKPEVRDQIFKEHVEDILLPIARKKLERKVPHKVLKPVEESTESGYESAEYKRLVLLGEDEDMSTYWPLKKHACQRTWNELSREDIATANSLGFDHHAWTMRTINGSKFQRLPRIATFNSAASSLGFLKGYRETNDDGKFCNNDARCKYPGPLFKKRGVNVYWDALYMPSSTKVRPCLKTWKDLTETERAGAKLLQLDEQEWDGPKPFTYSIYSCNGWRTYCVEGCREIETALDLLGFDAWEHTIDPIFSARLKQWYAQRELEILRVPGSYIDMPTIAALNLHRGDVPRLGHDAVIPHVNLSQDIIMHATNELISRHLGGNACLLEAFCFATGHKLSELGIHKQQCFHNRDDGTFMNLNLLNKACHTSKHAAAAFVVRELVPDKGHSFESLLSLRNGMYLINVSVETTHGFRLHYIVWDGWRRLLFVGGGSRERRDDSQNLAGILYFEEHEIQPSDPSVAIARIRESQITAVNSIKWIGCKRGLMHRTSHVLASLCSKRKK